MQFQFTNKGRTLQLLSKSITDLNFPKTMLITCSEIIENYDRIYERIEKEFANFSRLVVRSSASIEDSTSSSMAGQFTSILNIKLSEKKAFYQAITKVINSYEKFGLAVEDEVILVQI